MTKRGDPLTESQVYDIVVVVELHNKERRGPIGRAQTDRVFVVLED